MCEMRLLKIVVNLVRLSEYACFIYLLNVRISRYIHYNLTNLC